MNNIKIDVYSHAMHVRVCTVTQRKAMSDYAQQHIHRVKNWNRYKKRFDEEVGKIYMGANPHRTVFYLLATDLPSLLNYLEFSGISKQSVNIVRHLPGQGVPIQASMKEGYLPRKHQTAAVEFLSDVEAYIRCLQCRPGWGKTFAALWAVTQIRKQRCAFIMKSQHIKTWVKALDSYMGVKPSDIYVIKGSKALYNLMLMAEMEEPLPAFILFSNDTIRNMINEYEMGESVLESHPHEMMEKLGVGTLVYDECHERIHSIFRICSHLHVAQAIFLSATLSSKDAMVKRQYDRLFPKEQMYKTEKNTHIEVYPYFHATQDPKKIKWKGHMGYSHDLYEKSLVKDKEMLSRYLTMVTELIETTYVREYEPGKKMLVFCYRTDFVEMVADHLKKVMPDRTVQAYTSKTDEELLYCNDVVVSTPGSASTGVDIPGLSHAYLLVACGSSIMYEQGSGRLRPMDKEQYPDTHPKFYYLVNTDIRPHLNYHEEHQIDSINACKCFRKIISTHVI